MTFCLQCKVVANESLGHECIFACTPHSHPGMIHPQKADFHFQHKGIKETLRWNTEVILAPHKEYKNAFFSVTLFKSKNSYINLNFKKRSGICINSESLIYDL